MFGEMKQTLSRRKFITLSLAHLALLTSCDTSLSKETAPDVNIEVKIGQMLLVGFRGTAVHPQSPIVQDIRNRQIGGVIFYDYDIAQKKEVRNIQSPRQVKTLIRRLQDYSKIPLLVGIDYEGGTVNRLPEKYGFPSTVSHQYLGDKNDLAFTQRQATKMAKTLANLGFNLNFAPVVDVNTNYRNPIIAKRERSFSALPNIVAKHAIEFIKAHRRQNVLCTSIEANVFFKEKNISLNSIFLDMGVL